ARTSGANLPNPLVCGAEQCTTLCIDSLLCETRPTSILPLKDSTVNVKIQSCMYYKGSNPIINNPNAMMHLPTILSCVHRVCETECVLFANRRGMMGLPRADNGLRQTMPKPRASTQAMRTEATRAKLVNAAYNVFIKDGFSEAAIDAICRGAGYSRGAFYANFENKDDLFLAVYDRQLDSVRRGL